jgi:hypothetical protein
VDVTTETTEIQKIREYLENLYYNKFKNLEEIDKFIDTYDLPKFNEEDINHQSRSLNNKKLSPNKEKPRMKWIHC